MMPIESLATNQLTEEHYQLLLTADPSLTLIENYLPRSLCFQLYQDTLTAIILLLPTRPETLEIVNLAVATEQQQRGFGTQLLTFAIDYAKNHGYKTLEIGTGSTSFQQLALYQKLGFRMTSIDSDFFVHHYEEPIIENGLLLKDMVRLRLTF